MKHPAMKQSSKRDGHHQRGKNNGIFSISMLVKVLIKKEGKKREKEKGEKKKGEKEKKEEKEDERTLTSLLFDAVLL